jgi:hypothetical protein
MRQIRFALIAGAGVLGLCAFAVAWSIGNYASPQEAVANAHVGPVVAPTGGGVSSAAQAPAPVPTAAVTQVPVQSTPFPGVPNTNPGGQANPSGGTASQQQQALEQFLQQLQQRNKPPRH